MAEYTKEFLAELKTELAKAPKKAKPKDEKLTKAAVIKSLEPQIRAMQNRGYVLAEISEFLTGKGLKISKATLTAYLNTPAKTGAATESRKAPESGTNAN
jgi:hypothetical protein